MSEELLPVLKQSGRSKKTDAVLLIGIIALVAIGVMVSTGVFNFMGTHAAYLSYGMYGGAALLVAAEILKCTINRVPVPNPPIKLNQTK